MHKTIPYEAIMTDVIKLRKAISDLESSVNEALDTTIAELEGKVEEQGKKLAEYWDYMQSIYDYTCDMPVDKSTKPYSYTETLKEADAVKATLVTTMNADGTYTEVYTIGTNPARTRTWSKVDNQWKGVWS